MTTFKRSVLVMGLLALAAPLFAQMPCIQIVDTVHNANGTPYRGTITATLSYDTSTGGAFVHRSAVPITSPSSGRITACLSQGVYNINYSPDVPGAALTWNVPAKGGPYTVQFVETSAGAMAPGQLIPCFNNGDVLTTVNGVTTCAPPSAGPEMLTKLFVMRPVIPHQVLYYQFRAAHNALITDLAGWPVATSRTGHWAMALYDGTCTLMASTATNVINPLIVTDSTLSSPVSLLVGSSYFIAVTADTVPATFYSLHADMHFDAPDWTFTGSNPSTGTTSLAFPTVCGAPGIGIPPGVAGDIFVSVVGHSTTRAQQ